MSIPSETWPPTSSLQSTKPALLLRRCSTRERSWDPLLLYQLGLSRARRGDHAGAAVALARAAGADPSMERALRVLGQQLAALGRFAEAEVALRRAVQLNPRDRAARLALG